MRRAVIQRRVIERASKVKLVKTCTAAAAAALLSCVVVSPAAAAAPSAADFARVPDISQVQISRDGKHLVALTSPNGYDVTISVWRTDALNQKPNILGAAKMRITGVEFLKNDLLLVTAMQTYTVGSYNTHLSKQFVTDLEGKNWRPILNQTGTQTADEAFVNALQNAIVLESLPNDPRHVLVVDSRLDGGDLYKVDVYSAKAERVSRAIENTGEYVTDLKGEVRARTRVDYDGGKVYLAQIIRHPDTGSWDEHFRWYAKDRNPASVLGFDTDPNIAYVLTTRDGDKKGIYTYDVRARKFIEPVFQHKLFDAQDIIQSRKPDSFGKVMGFEYEADTTRTYWVDEKLAAIDKGLRNAVGIKLEAVEWTDPGTGVKSKISVPVGADAKILSSSADGVTIIVKSGPSVPGEYYMLNSGKLSPLGSARPWIKPESLGTTRLVQYTARDGLVIPGFLTTPPASFGSGPFPTLILPHGGPWSRDQLEWDVGGWTQYFASRGYAVLQPQFRGSDGWGQKLWRAGDGEWGQKMQDDKDDGAKWLIAQKIADPNRIAMFGYSYGGYAALAAAIRPNGLYQCAISGAGAPDLAEFRKQTLENRFQREFQRPSVDGLDVLNVAKTASIPVFLYHGDRDQTVDIKQSRQFAAALKSAGKPHKFLEIKDMGHGYITMTPAMLETQLVEIEKYLKTDCGPGGL